MDIGSEKTRHAHADKREFSREEIGNIAGLANLRLSEEEKRAFSGQFAQILDYVRKLDAADTGDAEPYSAVGLVPHFREDEPVASPASPEDFSDYLEDGHFKVPRVIE